MFNPIAVLKSMTARNSDHRNSLFQATWAALHLTITFLSFGSFVYHARRIKAKKEVECEFPEGTT